MVKRRISNKTLSFASKSKAIALDPHTVSRLTISDFDQKGQKASGVRRPLIGNMDLFKQNVRVERKLFCHLRNINVGIRCVNIGWCHV